MSVTELLLHHFNGRGNDGNSSGYQESSTSDSSDADSSSDSQKDHSSPRRRRGKARGDHRVSNSTQLVILSGVAKLTVCHFRKGLTKEKCTATLKKHPKPNAKAARPPKLDQFVVDFVGNNM